MMKAPGKHIPLENVIFERLSGEENKRLVLKRKPIFTPTLIILWVLKVEGDSILGMHF